MDTRAIRWRSQPAAAALEQPDVAGTWDRLNAERGNLPFLAARAMRAALAAFGTGTEQLFIGEHPEGVQALFLLVPEGRLRWRTFQPSQVPLGAWVARASIDLTDLTESLLASGPALCLVLSITQIDPRLAPRPQDGPRWKCMDYIDTGWLPVEGAFDAYWAARGKNLRQNLRKQRNKLQADGVSTTLRVHRSPDDVVAALKRYAALETTGWKAGQGTAIDADNAQGRFYRRLLGEAAEAGEALVFEYCFDERTVAMNLCLWRDRELIVLKTTYDESVPKAFSPASLLREDELQSFFAGDEVRRVEYYGRLMEWHTKLTDHKRTLYHLTHFRWSWLRKLADRSKADDGTPGEPAGPSASAPAGADAA